MNRDKAAKQMNNKGKWRVYENFKQKHNGNLCNYYANNMGEMENPLIMSNDDVSLDRICATLNRAEEIVERFQAEPVNFLLSNAMSMGNEVMTALRDALSDRLPKEHLALLSGSLLLHDLFQVAAIENEDGMPVIKYVDKPNGGSVAYVRHDAMVNKLNALYNLLTPPSQGEVEKGETNE